MPTKPNKVQAAGVAVFADGGILHRLQSVTADTDLGVEEIREISNSQVVEFVEGTPTVSIQLEGNMTGARNNIAYLTGQDGNIIKGMVSPGGGGYTSNQEITHFSFDGTTTDLVIQVEEDSVLARSIYMPNCFTTALSWNFDVGGVATESYSLEADDKRMFVGAELELVVASGYYTGAGDAGTSGFYVQPHPEHELTGYFVESGFTNAAIYADHRWTPIEATFNGDIIIDPQTGGAYIPNPGKAWDDNELKFPPDATAGGNVLGAGRYRVVGYKDATVHPNIVPTTDLNRSAESANLGGIRKGMIEIFLVSGSVWHIEDRPMDPITDSEEYLRLQTCSIDIDLSREALEELGNAEAYERSLNFPISATVNFSSLASDIQAWAGFANLREEYDDDWGGTVHQIGFRDFVQQAGVLIKVYNDDESNVSRKRLMTIAVSGVRVASESFSVDAGGNAVQEFSCSADNFVIS
jgi:hypothetical protein